MNNDTELNTIINIFFRHVELHCIKYDANKKQLVFEFAFTADTPAEGRKDLKLLLHSSMQYYYKQKEIEPLYSEISVSNYGELTLLNYYRDVQTLSDDELDLFIYILNQNYSTLLLADERAINSDSYITPKSNTYKNLDMNAYNNILAYREQGKVFVFNR